MVCAKNHRKIRLCQVNSQRAIFADGVDASHQARRSSNCCSSSRCIIHPRRRLRDRPSGKTARRTNCSKTGSCPRRSPSVDPAPRPVSLYMAGQNWLSRANIFFSSRAGSAVSCAVVRINSSNWFCHSMTAGRAASSPHWLTPPSGVNPPSTQALASTAPCRIRFAAR